MLCRAPFINVTGGRARGLKQLDTTGFSFGKRISENISRRITLLRPKTSCHWEERSGACPFAWVRAAEPPNLRPPPMGVAGSARHMLANPARRKNQHQAFYASERNAEICLLKVAVP